MKFLAGVVTTVVVGLAIGAFILGTGRFNVAATAAPDIADKVAPWVLEKSVKRGARDVANPIATDPGAVARGLSEYRENCLACHGAPGVDPAEFQEGMNPTPPGIDASVLQDASDPELFWVVKNGIRMTGMPAFGVNHSDDEIRDIVAFVRHAPKITDEERQTLTAPSVGEVHPSEARPPASPSPAASASPR
jgi:mono/diheme cytochrome c family protein